MNSKIKNYVDVLFIDIPRTNKAMELKEELLANMSDRFDDCVKEGYSENEAYTRVLETLGNIDEILEDVIPSDEFYKKAEKFRNRNARNFVISIIFYVLAISSIIIIAGFGKYYNYDFPYEVLGVVAFLFLAGISGSILIYTFTTTPIEYKDYNETKKKEYRKNLYRKNKYYKIYHSAFWQIVVGIYFLVSFLTGKWGITWIIFIIAPVIDSIIEANFRSEF